jgi:hypothetical protein
LQEMAAVHSSKDSCALGSFLIKTSRAADRSVVP